MLKKIPHTYVIVFCIIVVAAILTWFIPGGEYTAALNNFNFPSYSVSSSNSRLTVFSKFLSSESTLPPTTPQVFGSFTYSLLKATKILPDV